MQMIASDLSVRRGDDLLFMNVSLNLTEGQALILMGANGTGKSTLLRTLAGLIHPDAGSISLHGASIEVGTKAAEACHYLGHKNAMKSELSVYENLSFWKSCLGNFARQNDHALSIEEAVDAVGLSGILHLPFGYLSAGQQRRMAMTKLLIAYRPIWLLDEPTSALDIAADDLFVSLANTHLASGGIVIAATHQPLPLTNAKFMKMHGFSTEHISI